MAMSIIYVIVLWLCWTMDNKMYEMDKLKQKDRNFFVSFHFLFVIFHTMIYALRDRTVGADTASYLITFSKAHYRSYESYFAEADRSHEYLFQIITKFISDLTGSQIIYLGFFGALFAFCIGYVIAKNSENYFVSYVTFIALYMNFAIAGMRQVAAMSVLLISYTFIKSRKLIPFLLCVAVAYFFHNTSIIFVAAYFIAPLKPGKKYIVYLGVCIVMAYFLPGVSETILYDGIGWDKLEAYETYEATISSAGLIIKICILAFNLFYYKQTVGANEYNKYLYNFSVVGTGLQAFTVVMSQAFRMSMYFSIFDIILLANVLSSISNNSKTGSKGRIIITMCIVALILFYYFFVSGVVQYKMSI